MVHLKYISSKNQNGCQEVDCYPAEVYLLSSILGPRITLDTCILEENSENACKSMTDFGHRHLKVYLQHSTRLNRADLPNNMVLFRLRT